MAESERLLKQNERSRRLRAPGSNGWLDLYLRKLGYAANVDVLQRLVGNGATAPTSGGRRNAS